MKPNPGGRLLSLIGKKSKGPLTPKETKELAGLEMRAGEAAVAAQYETVSKIAAHGLETLKHARGRSLIFYHDERYEDICDLCTAAELKAVFAYILAQAPVRKAAK